MVNPDRWCLSRAGLTAAGETKAQRRYEAAFHRPCPSRCPPPPAPPPKGVSHVPPPPSHRAACRPPIMPMRRRCTPHSNQPPSPLMSPGHLARPLRPVQSAARGGSAVPPVAAARGKEPSPGTMADVLAACDGVPVPASRAPLTPAAPPSSPTFSPPLDATLLAAVPPPRAGTPPPTAAALPPSIRATASPLQGGASGALQTAATTTTTLPRQPRPAASAPTGGRRHPRMALPGVRHAARAALTVVRYAARGAASVVAADVLFVWNAALSAVRVGQVAA